MSPERPVGALFDLLWTVLGDLLGTPTAAILIRRSAERGESRAPGLRGISIERCQFEYRYALPASWTEDPRSFEDFRELVNQLRPLLEELTGPVVLHRLRAIPELVEWGLFGPEEGQ